MAKKYFISLEKEKYVIYNNDFTVYSINSNDFDKEKSKKIIKIIGASALVIITFLTPKDVLAQKLTNFKLNYFNTTSKIEQNIDKKINMTSSKNSQDIEQLNSKLPSVTKEEVINIINNNKYIDDIYKGYAIEFLEFMTNKYPNTNIRIFAENMKDLKVEIGSKSSFKLGVAGNYNIRKNTANIREDHTDDKSVIFHELTHIYYDYYDKENRTYYVSDFGRSLDEAMTAEITSGISLDQSYSCFKDILDYLKCFVDYTHEDYEKGRIERLIDMIKEKYPDIEIEKTINTLDFLHSKGTNMATLYEFDLGFFDELFKFALYSIDFNTSSIDNEVYEPFYYFYKYFGTKMNKELIDSYLTKYNIYLIENGYKDLDIEKVSDILYNNSIFSSLYTKYIYDTVKYEEISEKINDNIDINNLNKNNIYDCIFNDSLGIYPYNQEQFAITLEIYNNYLYCNGFNYNDTINSEKFREIANKYLDFKGIIGFNNHIYPIVGTCAKTNDQGIIETYYELFNQTGENYYININDKDISFVNNYKLDFYDLTTIDLFKHILEGSYFSDSFWEEAYGVSAFDYKKIPVYKDDIFVANEVPALLSVGFGITNSGEIGYKVVDNQNNVIYEDGLKETPSLMCSFSKYLNYLKNKEYITKLELNDVLNPEYIKLFISGYGDNNVSPLIPNISYDKENDLLEYHWPYYLECEIEKDKIITVRMNDCYIYCDKLIINSENQIEIFEFNVIYYDNIYLETVLDYYGLLSKDIHSYKLTKEQLIDLFSNYTNEIYGDKKVLIKEFN